MTPKKISDISLNETFRKLILLAPSLKKGTYKAPKTNFFMFIFTNKHKRKKFIILFLIKK